MAESMNATEYLLLFSGFLFWLGLLFVPRFREFMALLLSPLLGPIYSVSSILAMFVATFIVSLASTLVSRHYVDSKLQKSVAEQAKKLQKDLKTARRDEIERRQAALMRDQMAMYGQSIKSMCAISLISVPVYSWATTYILDSPAMIIGWIVLSIAIGLVLRPAVDRVWKK